MSRCLTNVSGKMHKPLIWDLVKDTARFQFMSADQVEHVVIDMAVKVTEKAQGDIWKEEKETLQVLLT